jgi:SLT domain-containing protein
MPFESRTTLRLLFEAPERNGISALHEQAIENVPTSIAKQIAEDFVGYEGTSSDVDRYRLYRIEEEGQEKRLISMDFGEVLRVSSALTRVVWGRATLSVIIFRRLKQALIGRKSGLLAVSSNVIEKSETLISLCVQLLPERAPWQRIRQQLQCSCEASTKNHRIEHYLVKRSTYSRKI